MRCCKLMKKVLYAVLFLSFVNASAQYAIINDPDGSCYMRSEPKKGENVVHTFPNGTIVYCVPVMPEGDWKYIDHKINGEYLGGYIHQSRLKFVSGYSKILVIKQTEKSIELASATIKIVAVQKDFNPENRIITYSTENPGMIDTIDGQNPWGTDGNMPRTEYESITVWLGDKKLELSKEAIGGLYEPHIGHLRATYNSDKDTLYIEASGSDAAGGYDVLWVIEKGKYKERRTNIPF